jgi:hypothetical protein
MAEVITNLATYEQQTAIKSDTAAILDKLGNVAATVSTVRHARMKVVNGAANLYFADPFDAQIDGLYTAFWQSTVIVRKNGSAPTSPTDGTVVVTNTTRNAYLETPFVDSNYTSGDVYRAFCYSTNGAYNASTWGIFKDYVLFGVFIDETDSNPATACHYVGDNAEYGRAYMDFINDRWEWGGWQGSFFMPRPCMLKTDGTIDYYLDPDDYTKKADGMTASDVADSSYGGNAMMEWMPVFIKVEAASGDSGYTVWFSDKKVDADFECYSGLKEDGTYGNWYTAIYEGSVTSNTLRSISTGALPNCQTTATNELTYARANGSGYTPMRWADEMLITYLGVLITGTLDFQTSICGAFTTVSSRQIKCGTCNTKGLFYGRSDGGIVDGAYVGNKMFGMENKFGHLWNRVVGAALVENVFYAKMTKHTLDGSTASDFITSDTGAQYTAGYIATGVTFPYANGAYIHNVGKTKFSLGIPRVVTGASAASFYCDAGYSSSETRGVLLGGGLADGLIAGRFACRAGLAPSLSHWSFSASLSYRAF